jgi:carboxypeptidase PM20D1
MKRLLLGFVLLLVLMVIVVLVRTLVFQPAHKSSTVTPSPPLDPAAIQRFRDAITYRTVSYADSAGFDSSQFLGFRRFLKRSYPLVHANLKREIVKDYTMIYHWEGESKEANPVVLMAHQDVVPVEESTRAIWSVDPFAGVIRDDFVWGRGSTDDKINLIAILEATEKLLAQGFRPKRSVYLVFGHDEEVGGTGAMAVAELFQKRRIRPELVLDEGGIVTREKVPGLKRNVALIGTSEKGFLSLRLTVEKGGGHAAMPERETAIDILATALTRLRAEQFEARFSPSTQSFIENVGPELPFAQRMAFANLWLFRPLVYGIYEQSNTGNAMIRTTLVPTIIDGGIKDNVIPTVATATLNIRLLPGDSSATIQRMIRDIVDDDRVHFDVLDEREASAVTSMETYAYSVVDQVVRKTYDSVVATPFLMIGATDSRHFKDVSDGIIKFSPMIDPIGFHGIDERVSLESFRISIWFFEQLIRDLK